jgi:hypothetical protein
MQDSRCVLSVLLVNKNGDEIPLLQAERLIVSSNLVRQVRSYLQPIPLALGAVLGALLVGIAGLFRRAKHPRPAKAGAPPEAPLGDRKQL